MLLERPGALTRVRFVEAPSAERAVRRLAVTRLADLEGPANEARQLAGRGPPGPVPFILLSLEPRRASARALQLFALLASRLGPSVDPYVATDVHAVRRIIAAHALGAERHLVASASARCGILTVWSCEPKLYSCRASDVPALAALSPRAQANVEVAAGGSRIHWAGGDVNLDLDAIRRCADPDLRRDAEEKHRVEAAAYGHAIRQLREEHGLRQGEIPGLSEREVRRLERGEVLPHAGTLRKLAHAHGLSLDQYMDELAGWS